MTKAETKRSPVMKRLIGFAAGLMLAASGPAWAQTCDWDGSGSSYDRRATCVTAMLDGNAVVLNWTPPAESRTLEQRIWRTYQIRKDTPDRERVLLTTLPANATTYRDATVEPGKAYWYAVQNSDRLYGFLSWHRVRYARNSLGDIVPISLNRYWPPHRLHIEFYFEEGESRVGLNWRLGTDPGYVKQKVLRRQAKGGWTTIAELNDNETWYPDRTAVRGETYIYAIRAERADGKGRRSKGVKFKVGQSIKPANLQVLSNPLTSSLQFFYTPGSSLGLDGQEEYVWYYFFRKKSGSETWVAEDRKPNYFSDNPGVVVVAPYSSKWSSAAEPGDEYFFRVKFEKANGEGRFSNKVKVVVPRP